MSRERARIAKKREQNPVVECNKIQLRRKTFDDATILERLQNKICLSLEKATAYLQQYGKKPM